MPFRLTKYGIRELNCKECIYLEGDTCTRNKCKRANKPLEEYKFRKELGDMQSFNKEEEEEIGWE